MSASNKIDYIKEWADTHIESISLTEEEMASYEKLCSGEEIYYKYFTEALEAYLTKNKKFWSYDDDSRICKLLNSVTDDMCNDELIEKVINELYHGCYQINYKSYCFIRMLYIDTVFQKRAILNVLSERLTDIIGRQCECRCYENDDYLCCYLF